MVEALPGPATWLEPDAGRAMRRSGILKAKPDGMGGRPYNLHPPRYRSGELLLMNSGTLAFQVDELRLQWKDLVTIERQQELRAGYSGKLRRSTG